MFPTSKKALSSIGATNISALRGRFLQVLNKSAFGILVAGALLLLIIIALQYPLSTTFPMGGDAPAYIMTVKHFLNFSNFPTNFSALTGSWYPLSDLILLPWAFIPLSWPMRFVWWAALGQIMTGLCFGWFMYRTFGRMEAIASVGIWAITPIIAISHFEDGTIAQLWSYAFVLLFLERFHANKPKTALIILLLVCLAHPVTGLTIFLVLVTTLPALWFLHKQLPPEQKKTVLTISLGICAAILIGSVVALTKHQAISQITDQSNSYWFDFITSSFQPVILLSPLGFILLQKYLRKSLPTLILLDIFILTTIALAFSNVPHLGSWSLRFVPLVIVSITVLGSIALKKCLTAIFKVPSLISLSLLMLFAGVGILVWDNNSRVYAFYESPARYARIHPDEIAAISWMQNNIPAASNVVASISNRHSEWIPALSSLNLISMPENKIMLRKAGYDISEDSQVKYFIFFLRRESVPKYMLIDPERYRVIFQNKGAVVINRTN